jgi:hypothetical protein
MDTTIWLRETAEYLQDMLISARVQDGAISIREGTYVVRPLSHKSYKIYRTTAPRSLILSLFGSELDAEAISDAINA